MLINTKCQVFTPSKNVKQLLDFVGYTHDIYGKKVAENSCGDGNILTEIVKRYILDCLRLNMDLNDIKKGIENDIWGAEIDESHILKCKNKLNKIALKYGLIDVSWNIFKGDFLKQNFENLFDFVIGNPPYITYKELDKESRNFLRRTFITCKEGKFDYCYAFIEASIRSLKSTGKLAYLIPSNIFKNRFAFKLRNYILPYLTDIYDYTTQKLFVGKLTASAILLCDINNDKNSFTYHNVSENQEFDIEKCSLTEKWIFKETRSEFEINKEMFRFGDYFHAASSIATLLNKVYIISDFIENEMFVQVKDYQIEKELLRIAKSPRSISYEKNEYVIFPYYYNVNGLQRYEIEQFQEKFPYGTEYLKQFEEELKKRNSDDGIKWYEYGRSQALTHLNQNKLLISTLITGEVKVNLLDKHTIPTSGLYIVPKDNNQDHPLSEAINVLNSDYFLNYVKRIGVISNGNSFRISPKDINNFVFPAYLLR